MSNNNPDQSRRSFLRNFLIVFGAGASAIVFIKNVLAFLFPAIKKKTYHQYLVSKKGEIPLGKAKKLTVGGTPVFVVHLESGYKVFSGICTHLGCIIRWETEKERFFCPCHKGIFNKTGQVTDGPPPRPLDEYKVKVDNNLVFMYVEDKTKGPWS